MQVTHVLKTNSNNPTPLLLCCSVSVGKIQGAWGRKDSSVSKEDNWDEISYVKGLAIAVLRLR
jgi:hypothetical protein